MPSRPTLKERAGKEIREIALVSAYFLVCFGFLFLLKKLLLAEYHIEGQAVSKAVIGALIIAKVVLILEKTPVGGRFASSRLVLHVAWRTLVYTLVVFVVAVAERLFEHYRDSGDLGEAVETLRAAENLDHVLAVVLCVGASLLVYNVHAVISWRLGEGELSRLFFARGGLAVQPAGGGTDQGSRGGGGDRGGAASTSPDDATSSGGP